MKHATTGENAATRNASQHNAGRQGRRIVGARANHWAVQSYHFTSVGGLSIPDSNFEDSELRDAVLIVGSTARGRGDYHFTPLDVLGGETSGVVVMRWSQRSKIDGWYRLRF